MSPVELLLSKIVFSIFNKAVLAPALGKLFQVISLIEACVDLYHCIETTNNCEELGVVGLKVVSDQLPEIAYDNLMNIGTEKFSVQRTPGGIYVASKLVPVFVATPADFPKFAASPMDFPKF